jgi:GAF domain-containing protein
LLEPAIPFDEAKRLATLRGLNILDTPPEERFDRLTRLAMNLFDIPIALVSLVDSNRQWFKSCQGLDVSETPRNISFCGHAILDDQTLIISDALLDPRFSDNPLVTGAPKIRFYAGEPLRAHDGSRMGTLCIIDRRPHQLSPIERGSLRDLAILVENELDSLELRELATELLNSQNRLAGILDNVVDAIISINEKGIIDSFNKSAAKIFGYSAEEVIGKNVNMLMPLPYKTEHDGYLNNYLTSGHFPRRSGSAAN